MIKKVNRQVQVPEHQKSQELQLNFFFGENDQMRKSARLNAISAFDNLVKAGLDQCVAKKIIEKMWHDAYLQGYRTCRYDEQCANTEKELNRDNS